MDALIVNLHDRKADRKHTELYTLLLSVFLSSKFDLVMPLLHHFKTLLVMNCQQTQQVFFEMK